MRLQKFRNTGTRISKTKLLPVRTACNNTTTMNSQWIDNQSWSDRNDRLNKVAAVYHFQKVFHSLPLGTKSTPEILCRRNPSVGWPQNRRRYPQVALPLPRCPWLLPELASPTKKTQITYQHISPIGSRYCKRTKRKVNTDHF